MTTVAILDKLAVWSAALLLGALVLAPVTPGHAQAQVSQLGVSLDGHTYYNSVSRPLFDPDRRWVPGDTESVSVWVRNLSADDAGLTVQVEDERGSGRLLSDLQLTSRADDAPLVVNGSQTYQVGAGGRPVQLDLTLTLPAESTNNTQQLRASFRLEVALVALASRPRPETIDSPMPINPTPGRPGSASPSYQDNEQRPDAAQRGGPLALTGAPTVVGVLLLALISLTAGSALLFLRSRLRLREDRHV